MVRPVREAVAGRLTGVSLPVSGLYALRAAPATLWVGALPGFAGVVIWVGGGPGGGAGGAGACQLSAASTGGPFSLLLSMALLPSLSQELSSISAA